MINIYKVQPRRNKALKSIALNILKYLPEDILREEPDFSSIKSNNTIQDYGACGEGVLECSCGVADDKDPSLSSEEEMDVDEENNEDGEVESTQPEETDSASSNSKGKKWANEATDSSASKKSKKHVQQEDSNILKKLIRELSSDTTRLSEIKEREGLHRKSLREFEKELEKRLAHFRKTNEDHEAQKMSDDNIQRMTYIQRVKSFTANSISNLSEDNIKYIASQVRSNARQT
ncbi:hypothetical protein C1645_877912 [Glomus cerebriforme]|uniref:Uncharacterized protein n=1 Tax=Glomus cerebriforme TaxID=658196 RepID=A0A397SUF6_9GLOM|nr:hypothetical protein C1645_877912 [Glomus cerebriforme]